MQPLIFYPLNKPKAEIIPFQEKKNTYARVFYRSVSLRSKLRSRAVQQSNISNSVPWLQVQTSSGLDLRSALQELIPEQQDRLKKIKSEHGKVQLGNISIDMVLGGMRGMTGLLWETSLLDPDEGTRFWGLSIPKCEKVLPAAKPGGEPLPEGLLWLLLTGKVPSKEQVNSLSQELQSRATIPDHHGGLIPYLITKELINYIEVLVPNLKVRGED